MKGYSDRVLRVDLSSGKSTVEDLDEKEVKLFLGGLALAAYRLYKEVPGGADPLGKENKLIFSPGLLVGTGLPTLSKSTFVFKSPLTGGFGRAVAGAKMGVALKKAGYDLLIVEGKSKAPVYLRIKDDEVSLEDASNLWGKNAFETQNMLKEKYGKCNTAAIGPAGENLSFISSIDLEERQAARGGPGAVMGSKKLKAIAVTGTGSVDYYNLSDLKKTVNHWVKIIKDHPATKVDMDYGTGEFYAWMNKERGTFPSRNWQWGYFHTAFDGKKQSGIDPYNWVPKMRVGRNPCPNCTKPCSQVVELKKYSPGTRVDGPEYETIYSLGGELEIDDPEGLAYLNYLCDVYGLDTISAGVTIGWAMEAYERGLLSKEDVDGVDLRFGSVEAAAEALKKMAYREGKLGKLLADGSREASRRLGKDSDRFAIHVKGLELPAYDVRGIKGMALAIAVSYRGACHLTAGVYGTELVGSWWKFSNVDRLSFENKGFEVKLHEDLMQLYDTLGACKFSRHMFFLEGFPEMVYNATGFEMTHSQLLTIGERAYNIARAFNAREGFNRKDDTLPWRVLYEPIPKGVSEGSHVSPRELEHMLDEYYQARGWSMEGLPTKVKLISLDLDEIAEDVGV